MRRPLIFAFALSVGISSASVSSLSLSLFTDKYDKQIEIAVRTYWPDYPYPLAWKAQLYQESLLDPNAQSPVGAEGIAQFMPATWAQVSRELGYGLISPRLADQSINAGAYYVAKMRKIWRYPRPKDDQHWLAVASYNAGAGSLIKAQTKCGGVLLYNEIIRCLPQITGRYSIETITYVNRIKKWWKMLEVL